jgi:hypothetical protein
MQSNHQPASTGFTAALRQLVQRTEVTLQQRIEHERQRAQNDESLDGAGAEESDFDTWLEAGGDLLMGRKDD